MIKERWVIKAGSSLVASEDNLFNQSFIAELSNQVNLLIKEGIEVIIVSSGAVAKGLFELNLSKRPTSLHLLQATAAIGQVGLINAYKQEFSKYSLQTAQVLISHDDVANRTRYLNARRSLQTLLELGVVPIVNENDSVATEEISFGDNDTLAGMITGLVDASRFVMLTDQIGICTSNPNINQSAKLVSEINLDKDDLSSYLKGSYGVLGRGGIQTKLKAARLGLDAGSEVIVADGRNPKVLLEIKKDQQIGTSIIGERTVLKSRKQWIANQPSPLGTLIIDRGACEALRSKGTSLLPVGTLKVEGKFEKGSLVSCKDEDLKEVAKGLINFNSEEVILILGNKSNEIASILGYSSEEEIIHRDNLVLTKD